MPSEPKPATPLPKMPLPWGWRSVKVSGVELFSGVYSKASEMFSRSVVLQADGAYDHATDSEVLFIDIDDEDAAYIVHACNTLAELQKPCVWTWEYMGDYFRTSCFDGLTCGERLSLEEGTTVGTAIKFCPYCGHPIQEVTEDE